VGISDLLELQFKNRKHTEMRDPTALDQPRIVIAGAGAIGCFVGGLLAVAGRDVTFLGRPRILGEIEGDGLTLTDFAGLSRSVHKTKVNLSDDPRCLADADLVLVAVKSGATAAMADLIGRHAPETATVVSLQNGMDNVATLRARLEGRDVRAGMVGFNVVPKGSGRFHKATSGEIIIQAGPGGLKQFLTTADMTVHESDRIEAVQWGKLLVNLNNALNALSGLTIPEQLGDRAWRRLMADQMAEALTVLKQAGIVVQSTTPLPAWMTPQILRLPTILFSRVAAQMLTVDPSARSSMAYDLRQRRKTEIGSLQGEIISLGKAHNVPVPICTAVAEAVSKAETARAGSPKLSVKHLRALL
jgi:2-dehydropantoate 2-reductase